MVIAMPSPRLYTALTSPSNTAFTGTPEDGVASNAGIIEVRSVFSLYCYQTAVPVRHYQPARAICPVGGEAAVQRHIFAFGSKIAVGLLYSLIPIFDVVVPGYCYLRGVRNRYWIRFRVSGRSYFFLSQLIFFFVSASALLRLAASISLLTMADGIVQFLVPFSFCYLLKVFLFDFSSATTVVFSSFSLLQVPQPVLSHWGCVLCSLRPSCCSISFY